MTADDRNPDDQNPGDKIDDRAKQSFDRRGPDEIEPGHKGGSAASQGRSVTKDADTSDKPGAETRAEDRPPRM